MKPFRVKEVLDIVDGVLDKGDLDLVLNAAAYRGGSIGESHTLIFHRVKLGMNKEIIEKYSPCALVTSAPSEELREIEGCTVIAVEDVEAAFWAFVEHYRRLFPIPIVAITGTCGKTTTKDMLVCMLKKMHWNVQATIKSFNSRTQNLHYLTTIEEETEVGIFETAVGIPGDLRNHFRYFQPGIGVITNIGVYHLDGCKTPEGYLQAKAEMVESLEKGSTLILNADDENTKKIDLTHFEGRIVYFGVNHEADIRAANIQYGNQGNHGMSFDLWIQNKSYPVFVPGYGEHQVSNALSALAVLFEMDVNLEEAIKYLATFVPENRHLQFYPGVQGATIIDDTWSSTPTSIESALKVLKEIGNNKKTVAVIAEIKRLDQYSLFYHQQVGEMIANAEVDILITIGAMTKEIAQQARLKGWMGEVFSFENEKGVYERIIQILDNETIILFKSTSTNKELTSLKRRFKMQG